MFEVTEKTGNGNNPQFMNPLHALMYEAFYLGNSGTRRVDYAKFEKEVDCVWNMSYCGFVRFKQGDWHERHRIGTSWSPWGKFSVPVTEDMDTKTILKTAGIDWTVEERPFITTVKIRESRVNMLLMFAVMIRASVWLFLSRDGTLFRTKTQSIMFWRASQSTPRFAMLVIIVTASWYSLWPNCLKSLLCSRDRIWLKAIWF